MSRVTVGRVALYRVVLLLGGFCPLRVLWRGRFRGGSSAWVSRSRADAASALKFFRVVSHAGPGFWVLLGMSRRSTRLSGVRAFVQVGSRDGHTVSTCVTPAYRQAWPLGLVGPFTVRFTGAVGWC